MEDGHTELVAIGSAGQSLRVELLGPYNADALDPETRGWLNAAIHVEAFPFSGSIRTVLTPDDVIEYRHALAEFAASGRARLGGGRAAKITLERDGQVIEVTVTPSGDDPQPFLRFLILGAAPVE